MQLFIVTCATILTFVTGEIIGNPEFTTTTEVYRRRINVGLKSNVTISKDYTAEISAGRKISGKTIEDVCTNEKNTSTESVATTEPIATTFDEDNETVPKLNITTTRTENYAEALKLSFLFFEAQRSGMLPKDNRIPWRGDSAMGDRGRHGEDLTGGYYNSGDSYVKYAFPTAFTTTMLAWGLLSWPEGFGEADQAYEAYKAIKWATDYFIKCHPSRYLFYVQVGSERIEDKHCGRPEEINYTRPAYAADSQYRASDILAETAAALAAASIVYEDFFLETPYSKLCLRHAKRLYKFALRSEGSHYDWMPDDYDHEVNIYEYGDDLAWASLWLYRATKQLKYLRIAEDIYESFALTIEDTTFNYYSKVLGVEMMFAENAKHSVHTTAIIQYCDKMVETAQRTKEGLVYLDDRDTLSLAANAAFLCLKARPFNVKQSNEYYNFARRQIDYMLGTESGRSYVVGYGENFPAQPYHKAACPSRPAPCKRGGEKNESKRPQILYGALVSGPNNTDDFEDDRRNANNSNMEVNIEYNAGFTGALAALLEQQTKNTEINSI